MRDEETGSAASLTLLVWQGLVLDIYIAPDDDSLRSQIKLHLHTILASH